VILNPSSGLDLVLALELRFAEDGTAEICNPNLRSSHRRRQLTGINPGKSHGQGPWVSYRKHRLDDKLVGKQEDTFLLDILMMEVWLQWMPRLERSRLGLPMMLDVFCVAPPSLYILG
jgi:hypothetical protein